ncbi:hypothetical protein HYY71_06925 [Candidatus Woesearchaeota archaeon]|nr:hypothetical protein [Candidatus Woesearchaeota archaeon]
MIIDASPLIIFGKLNKISILKKLYKNIEVTNEVYNEAVLKGIEKNSKDAFIIKEYVDNKTIKVFRLEENFYNIANKIRTIYRIDIGEAETIALALQLNKKEAMLDELSAREAAEAFGIVPIGSLRVLLTCYGGGLINKEEINELLNEMENSKYRFSPKVLIEFWSLFDKIKRK